MPANRPQRPPPYGEAEGPNLATRVYDRPTAPPRPIRMGENAQVGAAASGGPRGRRLWIVLGAVLVIAAAAGVAVGYGIRGDVGSPSAVGSSGTYGSANQPPGSTTPPAKSSASATPSASATASESASASHPKSTAKPTARTTIGGPTIPDRPNCGPSPSACGLPDASNTGVPPGTKLTVVSGDLEVNQAGTVVSGKDIRGCVTVDAPNVTIRDSKITCTGYYGIGSFTGAYSGGRLRIEDVEVDCQDHNTTAVGSYNVTALRMNIHGCENGFDIDNTFTVQDTYIHDLYEGATGHADGIQLPGGSNITITHNTIFDPGGTSAIISNPDQNSDVLVQSNLMAGGAYTLYCPRDSSTNYRVIGNRVSTVFSSKGGEFGPWTDCGKVAVNSGNVWDNTLAPLPPG